MPPLTYRPNDRWSHAGGIVYRDEAGVRRILMVRARPAPHEWVLPKGHIENGETADRAAEREVREEAGIEAESVAFAGEIAFTSPRGEPVCAAFFLMRFVREVAADEDREMAWCTFAEAIAFTPFSNIREILRSAESLIARGLS